MRWKSHVRFGRRAAETDRSRDRHRAAARPHTYVATWSGTVYVAFVLAAHSRRILGWRTATSMRTELVLTKEIARKLTMNGTGAAGRTGGAEEVPGHEPEAPGLG